MLVIDAQLEPLPGGGILYDAARIRKPSAQLFSREFWASQGSLREVRGGRGSVCFLRPGLLDLRADGESSWVLRHYQRGGLIAKVSRDRYFWTGAVRTRCFREWHLLAELYRRGLPVPAPVAARYDRSGLIPGLAYRADLITVQLPASQTLAALLAKQPLSRSCWNAIGRTIAEFHEQGVEHADLNAHNILLDADHRVFVLDFDRGRLRGRGSWEKRVLARLHRSLEKVTASQADVYGPEQWRWLMEAMTSI